jgi:hypothetical protein
MCLLTFLPENVQPDLDALACGAQYNQDGHGFALVDGRELIVRHGMNAAKLIDTFAALRRERPHGPALFHSRYATHGTRTLANCHPFTVGGDQRTVLAHNGILPTVVQPGRRDRRSDTRIAAEDFLSVDMLRLRRHRLALDRWMTPDNKIVLLTVDRRFRRQAYILNEQAGIWHRGIWYSNQDYRPETGGPGSLDLDGWDAADLDLMTGRTVLCRGCWTAVDPTEAMCPVCGCCADCGDLPGVCVCYAPAPSRR